MDRLPSAPPLLVVLLYGSTIFLSSFLLFLIQPIFAKQILPWFGGSSAVWTTCLVFFQTGLLLGYFYAHRLASFPRWTMLHVVLLAGSLFLLPVIPSARWIADNAIHPALRILL